MSGTIGNSPISTIPISSASSSGNLNNGNAYNEVAEGGVLCNGYVRTYGELGNANIEFLKASSLLIMGNRRDFRVTSRTVIKHSSSMFQDRTSPLERL